MATIVQRQGKWQAEIRLKGYYRCKTFRTKGEAKQWVTNQEAELGRYGDRLPSHTLGQAMQRFADEVSPLRKGARWEIVRLQKLKRDPIADIVLTSLRQQDLQDWIDRQTLSAGTIRRELDLIQAVMREARVRWKWMRDEITKDLRRPPAPKHRDRRISEKEITSILEHLGFAAGVPPIDGRQQVAVAFQLALETAMRQGEIWGLQWDKVDLEQRYVILPDTKNGQKREVALSRRAVTLLESFAHRQGPVFTVNQAVGGQMYRKAVAKAGIENLTFHDTRHEAITRLARKLDVLDLARMVGHKDVQTLMIYYNASASEIASRLD